MKVEQVCHSQPSTRQFNFHVLRQSGHRGIRYTIGVWEGQSLRAICHSATLSGCLLAFSSEIGSAEDSERLRSVRPEWDDLRRLVERLRNRADEDSGRAAEHIEDLRARLHHVLAETDIMIERITQLGALIEAAASRSRCIGNSEWTTVAVPNVMWFTLLAAYRGNQVDNPVYREIKLLREIASITAHTVDKLDRWLGKDVPTAIALEALCRLKGILNSAGYRKPTTPGECRGPLIRAMEEAGIGLGHDGKLRLRQPDDIDEKPATGPLVKEILQAAHQTT